MNEQEIARLARQALDESAEHLPWRVTHRLATAREAALARMPARAEAVLARPRATAEASHPVFVHASGRPRASGGGGGPEGRRRLGLRIAAVVVPILIVAAGLFGISEWDSWQRASDTADLDAAVLIDEVPISAYADRGFGVFLRNVAQGERE